MTIVATANNSPVITTVLTTSEKAELNGCEAIIERGMSAYADAGRALAAIHTGRLYRSTHATFADYCLERWGWTDRHVRRLMLAADVVNKMVELAGPMGPLPASERQARELVGLQPGAAVEVVVAATENGEVTAASLRQAREDRERAARRTDASRRRPLTDDMRSLAVDAMKLERKIARLLDDDRLDRNAVALARYAGDLRRLDDLLVRLMVRTGVAE